MLIDGTGSSFLPYAVIRAFSLPIVLLRASFAYRFCLDAWIRFVARNDLLFDLDFQQALDVVQEPVFVDADQRDGMSLLPRSGSSTDTMYIVFGNVWQFIVDDVR